MTSQEHNSDDSILARIVDEYTDQRVRGDSLDFDAILSMHPEYASVLRDVLPAIDALVNRHRDQSMQRLMEEIEVGDDQSVTLPILDNYEYLSRIGGGGMGVIIAARDRRLNRNVAIKFLSSRNAPSSGGLERFQIEGMMNAHVQHPQIVQVFEVGEQEGHPYLVLEYCDGGDLATKSNNSPQDPRWAANLVKVLCSGLAAAHDAGLIHRDIKPANILFSSDDTPKLADFGLAKRIDIDSDLTVAGTVLGTPSYMAPEQASGLPNDASQTADIYSLGAVLYELLIGKPPFKGITSLETMHQVRFLEPVAPRRLRPSIPRDLETICLKCLRKDTVDRYQSAMELAADLDNFLFHRPIRARRISPVERAIKLARRSPWLVALITLLPLSILAGAIGVWFVDSHSRKLAKQQSERLEVAGLATAIIHSDIGHLPELLQQMNGRQSGVHQQLQLLWMELNASATSSQRLNFALASSAIDPVSRDDAWRQLLVASPEQLPTIATTLSTADSTFPSKCLLSLSNESHLDSQGFRLATSLALLDPNSAIWNDRRIADMVARELLRVAPSEFGQWRELLLPVMDQLVESLRLLRSDAALQEQARLFATDLLSERAMNDPHQLFDLLTDSGSTEFRMVLARADAQESSLVRLACEHLESPIEQGDETVTLDQIESRAKAAAYLLHCGHGEVVWPLLRHSPDPTLRAMVIDWIPKLEVPIATVLDQLLEESDTSIQFALVLCLGDYSTQDDVNRLPAEVYKHLRALYETHPDAGLHSAIGWLIRHDHSEVQDQKVSCSTPLDQALNLGQRWFVNSQDQTFAIIDADEFLMGSDIDESWRDQDERQHRRNIGRRFAIATTEVTRGAILRWRPDFNVIQRGTEPRPNCPIGAIDWYDAAAYCNWLSEQDGLPVEQWCYEPNANGDYAAGMKARAGFLELQGYRLPTEAEWEYACRAGTVTKRYFGDVDSLLTKYAWYSPYANDQCHEVGALRPNDFGLFDMLGNEYEWCHDLYRPYLDPDSGVQVALDQGDSEPATHDGRRVLRGGSFDYSARHSRAAYRTNDTLDMRISNNGFRPARSILHESSKR